MVRRLFVASCAAISCLGVMACQDDTVTEPVVSSLRVSVHGPETLPTGQPTRIRVGVFNRGPVEVGTARLVLDIAGPVTTLRASHGPAQEGSKLVWPSRGPVGVEDSLLYVVEVRADGEGVVDIRASASSDEIPGGEVADEERIATATSAGLSAWIVETSAVAPGDSAEVVVGVTNGGPAALDTVEVSAIVSGHLGSVEALDAGQVAGGDTVRWPRVHGVLAGDTVRVRLRVTAGAAGPIAVRVDARGVAVGGEESASAGSFVGVAPRVLQRIEARAPKQNGQFGRALLRVRDVDGDGVEDIAVGHPGGGAGTEVEVLSGSDLRLLGRVILGGSWTYADRYLRLASGTLARDGRSAPALAMVVPGTHSVSGQAFVATLPDGDPEPMSPAGAYAAWDVAFLPDLNGDGSDELVYSHPRPGQIVAQGTFFGRGTPTRGHVTVVSGADGSELWSVQGGEGETLGIRVITVPDRDGDGVGEVAALAAGGVVLLSGRDGRRLGFLPAPGSFAGWVYGTLLSPGDLTGDGVPDLWVAGSSTESGGWMMDGVDGSVVYGRGGDLRFDPVDASADLDGDGIKSFFENFLDPRFGPASPLADVDGDGAPELAVVASGSALGGPGAGRLYVLSGATGSVLRTFVGATELGRLGGDGSVLTVPDRTGDGVPELLLADEASPLFQGHLIVVEGIRPSGGG